MLYFVFTVDGDWDEYFNIKLPEVKRAPNLQKILKLVDKEINFASKMLKGKFIHFVHTSPRARDFFLRPEFVSLWEKIERKGGNIGVHCHEDDPHRAYYFKDPFRMEESINFFSNALKRVGLVPVAYRGGYMAFSPKTIPILESNDIFLDFSCEPGRYLIHGNNLLVSDWRGAPETHYRLSYTDHRKPGQSRAFEIPVGSYNGKHLYPECFSILQMWGVARRLKKRARKEDVVVSVLAHTFEFANPWRVLKIRFLLSILKLYGKFVNAGGVLAVVRPKQL